MLTLSKISNIRSQLSPSELKIADYILASPEQVTHFSSQELALQADVSQSSIVKFTQKIGFKGFTAFKLAVSEDLGRKHAIKTDNVGDLYNGIGRDDDLETMAKKLAQEKINSIIETTQAIDNGTLERVLDAINQAGRVQLVGIGGSALTAKDLWYKLLKIGVTTLFAQDSHVQISIAQTLGPGDVQLVVSYSGSSRDVLAAAELAKRNGATLIAVTSFRSTPLRQMADLVLDTVAEENELRISSISSRTAQNTITDILFLGLVQRRDEQAWALIDGTRGAIDRLNKE
ncbi:SIS domain-containing protein [Aeromonas bestiarum]|jgi:RpiR family transcriptional regulator, murPQ operon repressor|uniref:SIS domain-containing protein n=1 Tax=Aeromonas bestiarum TaxID=105751 RepID=UPI00259DBB38|nr:SIS domain-containing protein [Aeromonas bestiarum]MDM5090823.1 SIS domain-containing protein [Aeromonas bestiarum]